MKLTNVLNLPEPIVAAVANDPYDKGSAHISVTGLIAPARKRALEHLHADELTEDVTDRIWALFGQVMHGILERAGTSGIRERRLFIDRHGWTISGQFDHLNLMSGLLSDYKSSSTYAVKDGNKPEWEAQINIYAMMAREHGYDVQGAETVVVLRDWQKSKSKHSADYPQTQVVRLPVTLWPEALTERYITDRLRAHGKAQFELPECGSAERWERPGVYALMKVGNTRATKIFGFDEKDAAESALADARATAKRGAEFVLETRPSEQIRCASYCVASKFCSQWALLNPNKLGL